MKQNVLKDTTSYISYIFIRDSSVTTGAGLTGLVYNSAGLVAYYVRPQGSATAITLATQTVTGAYSSGGFVEVSSANMPGLYRFDIPNACLATGVNSVVIELKGATNMEPVVMEIQLVSYNPNDAVRLGLTALPNAAADGAGGLPISDAGGLDLDGMNTNVSSILTDTADMQPKLGTITDLGSGATIGANLVDIEAQTDDIGAAGAGLTAIPWNAAWDTEVQSEVEDGLAVYDPPTYTELLNLVRLLARSDAALATDLAALLTTLNADLGSGAGDYANTTDSLEASQAEHDQTQTDIAGLNNLSSADVQTAAAAAITAAEPIDANITQIDGLATNGNNATLNLKQLNIVNSAGSALVASATGSNGHGINISGNGTGHGLNATGGATGHGINGVGGATSGDGMRVAANSATNGNGLTAFGRGTGRGIDAEGTSSGAGIYVVSGTGRGVDVSVAAGNNDAVRLVGAGTGHGLNATGGATGNGINARGGATSGNGIDAAATTSGDGMQLAGAGAGLDLDAAINEFTATASTAILDAMVDDSTRIDASALNTASTAIGSDGTGLTEAGGTGDHLTAIDLPDQTMNITGNITGNLSGSVGSVTGAVGSVTGNVGGNVTGSVGSLATQAKADVNGEIVDALATDTYAEPGQGAPAATTTLAAKINYLYKFARNKITQTSTTLSIYDDAGTTVDQKATISDDSTTYTRGEIGTGP